MYTYTRKINNAFYIPNRAENIENLMSTFSQGYYCKLRPILLKK